MVLIRNTSTQPYELMAVDNEQVMDFQPGTIQPGQSIQLFIITAAGLPMPGELTFTTPSEPITVKLDLSSRPS